MTYLTAAQPTKATLSDKHGRPGLKGGNTCQGAIPLLQQHLHIEQNRTCTIIASAAPAAWDPSAQEDV